MRKGRERAEKETRREKEGERDGGIRREGEEGKERDLWYFTLSGCGQEQLEERRDPIPLRLGWRVRERVKMREKESGEMCVRDEERKVIR